MINPEFVFLTLLIIVSIIDVIFKKIPSILLTTLIIFNLSLFPQGLYFGVLGFLIAWLLYEFDFINGIGDIKIFIALSILVNNITEFYLLVLLVVILGFFWKVIIRYIFPKLKEYAFIPVFLFSYIALNLINYLN